MAAGHVIVVVAVALFGGGLFNAQALTDAAASQPFGWKRTIAVVAATPFRGIAGLLGLDAPHRVLASAAASATGSAAGAAAPSEAPGPPEDDPVGGTTTPPGSQTGAPGQPSEPGVSPSEAAQSARERREATRRKPLQLWVGGDSLTSEFGPALADTMARTRRADSEVDFRFSTGLARPDFFDWPAHLEGITTELDPDVFVVMFGANDGQNIAVKGKVLTFGSPEWEQEYADRVSAVMETLNTDGRQVIWIGQPIMRSADFDAKMQTLNKIYAARAEAHEGVAFVDTRPIFAGPDGAYSAYLTDAQGTRTLMRQQDGIHLTRAGGERLTDVVFKLIDDEWKLTKPPQAQAP